MPEQPSWLLIHAADIPPCFLRPVKVSTSPELYPDYTFGCLLFLIFQASSFLIHLPFPNTVSQTIPGYLPFIVQHQCYLQDAMPCQWSPNASHPNLTYDCLQSRRFLQGDKYSRHAPLLSYLIQLSQNKISIYLSLYLSISIYLYIIYIYI